MPFSPISEAIAELKAGRMIVLTDDDDRENEGDIVALAEHITPEQINFMLREARGMFCLALSPVMCDDLRLDLQAAETNSRFGTAFTVTVDAARGITTGVSANDRWVTVQTAMRQGAKPEDLIRPGHVSPLRARRGGVLERDFVVAKLVAENDGEIDEIEAARKALDANPLTNRREFLRLSGNRFDVALRGEATEQWFHAHPRVKSARIIHFAGHGEANLIRGRASRLVFSRSTDDPKNFGPDDGFLYLAELRDIDISPELLVLSACETSIGELDAIDGLHSLTWAGFMAGAKSVLSTLWRVDDEAAHEFVVDFYTRWLKGGKTKVRALAEAKRAAIRRGAPIRDWAAYVLWDASLR